MELVTVIFGSKMEEEAIFGDNSLRFGDILKLDFGKEYEEIKDNIKLVRVLEEKQEEFSTNVTSKLVFFDGAIDHILRITRVLRQKRGSMMLIGVGGSGK